jgi:DNA polymerase-3 subunit delta'
MTESAANALLKALEEPTGNTIWLLCAPTIHDVLPTIRSRCRHLNLKTPSTIQLVDFLIQTQKVKPDEAELAARISQGHVGKARAFLDNSDYRTNRKQAIEIFMSITTEARALRAAAQLLELAEYRAESRITAKSELELEELKSALQGTGRGMISGGAKAVKDLERDQKVRLTRATKDELDAILLDLELFLADCLAPSEMWRNVDLSQSIKECTETFTQEAISSLIGRIKQTRESLTGNTSQTLLLESLTLDFSRVRTGH